jgi:glycosyltransferase involved in cell wall biosynthesis
VWLWRATPEHYDAILVSDKFLVAIAALLIARIRKIKFLYWMTFPLHKANVSLGREGTRRYPLVSMIRGYLSELSLKHLIIPYSDHIFVQSQRMRENFEDLGASREKMTPIVTGIDLTEVAPATSLVPCDEKRHHTIAYLGTLASERRLEVLVDMLAQLRTKGVTANLLLIGDGEVSEDQLRIRRRAEQFGLQERIEITGFLPRAEALERLRGADVCVSPIYPSPLFDGGSPTKLVEYMAAGLPVVANRHPDQDQVLRASRAGISVPWGARHFARAVHRLLACTDTERKIIGMRGQSWVVKHRSYAVIADDFERSCLQTLSIGTTAR